MQVFISWSGPNSQAAAAVLAEALPVMIQSVTTFVSADGLRKGGRWQAELSNVLQATSVGILCMTKSNLAAPWILFEAGALSKVVQDSCVMPLLLGLTPSEIRPPLSQFNVTRFDKDDFFKLVKEINSQLGDRSLSDKVLIRAFEQAWPEIDSRISKIIEAEDALIKEGRPEPEPPLAKMSVAVEEILSLVRSQSNNSVNSEIYYSRIAELERMRFAHDLHKSGADNRVSIELSGGFIAEVEKRRREILTCLYQLSEQASKKDDKRIKMLLNELHASITPLFRRLFGEEEPVNRLGSAVQNPDPHQKL